MSAEMKRTKRSLPSRVFVGPLSCESSDIVKDSESPNPYEVVEVDEATGWIRARVVGECLVVGGAFSLPERCIVTNEPATSAGRSSKTFHWQTTVMGLGAMGLGTKCELTYSIGPTAAAAKKWDRAIGWLVLIGVLLIVQAYAIFGSLPMMFTLIGLVLAGIVWVGHKSEHSPSLWLSHYEDDRFWLRGFGKEFLDQLREELEEPATLDS